MNRHQYPTRPYVDSASFVQLLGTTRRSLGPVDMVFARVKIRGTQSTRSRAPTAETLTPMDCVERCCIDSEHPNHDNPT